MSLFQVREWWGVKSESCEEYTHGALVVGNVDNDASGQGTFGMHFDSYAQFGGRG